MATNEIEFPTLPKPWDLQHDDSGKPQVLFTAQQMQAHAGEQRQTCANKLNPSRAEVMLHCGEMTAAEWRTVAAVLRWMQTRVLGPNT